MVDAWAQDLAQLSEALGRGSERYREFLRVPALSAGLYRLAAGSADTQRPHAEDEIYVVLRGRGRFRRGTEDRPVGAGELLFVPARLEHRFHDIEEELLLLVVFAPAESHAETIPTAAEEIGPGGGPGTGP